MNNISRVTIQTLAAVFGGTQSLHTNGYDEALNLPTEEAAGIALKTQQVAAFESGIADTADPLGGSYFVESLTDEVEANAWKIIETIDAMGGSAGRRHLDPGTDTLGTTLNHREPQWAGLRGRGAAPHKLIIKVSRNADAYARGGRAIAAVTDLEGCPVTGSDRSDTFL